MDDLSLSLEKLEEAGKKLKKLFCWSKLLILLSLASNGGLTFSEIKYLTGISDGTLGKFLNELQTLNLITKVSLNGKSVYKLTQKGRRTLLKLLDLIYDFVD